MDSPPPASDPPPGLPAALPDLVSDEAAPFAPTSAIDAPSSPAPRSEPHASPAPTTPSVAPESPSPDSRPVDLSAPVESLARATPLPNGDFERSTAGWQGSNAVLTLVRDGVAGRAVRVTRASTKDSFVLRARKELTSANAGAAYNVGAFVRSLSPGMFVCIRVEEYAGGPATTNERCVAAESGWRRLRLEGMTAKGNSRLVFSIHVLAALGGTSFDVDGFRLGARNLA